MWPSPESLSISLWEGGAFCVRGFAVREASTSGFRRRVPALLALLRRVTRQLSLVCELADMVGAMGLTELLGGGEQGGVSVVRFCALQLRSCQRSGEIGIVQTYNSVRDIFNLTSGRGSASALLCYLCCTVCCAS